METTTVKKKRHLGLMITLMMGYTMAYMDKALISTAMIPIAKQYNLSSSQTGLIMSAFFLSYALTQIPSGWLADKFGSKVVLLTALSFITLFAFLFGIVSHLFIFMLIRFLAGVGQGGYPSATSRAITENFDKKKRTFVQSLMLSTSGIGGILAFTLGANLIAINWRYAYLLLGTLCLIATLLAALFLPKKEPAKATATPKTTIKYITLLTNRNVLLLFSTLILVNYLLYGIMSWLPTYMSQQFDLTISTLGILLAINAAFQTVGSFSAGLLLSKLFLGRERLFIIGLCIASALFLVGFILATSLIVSMILLLLLTTCSVAAFTAIFSWPHKLFEETIIGSVIGLINTGSAIGGVLAPMTLGFLIERASGSFFLAFISMAVAILASALIVLFIKTKATANR